MGERKSEVYTHSDISEKKWENKMEVDFLTAKSNFEEGMRFFGISAFVKKSCLSQHPICYKVFVFGNILFPWRKKMPTKHYIFFHIQEGKDNRKEFLKELQASCIYQHWTRGKEQKRVPFYL